MQNSVIGCKQRLIESKIIDEKDGLVLTTITLT